MNSHTQELTHSHLKRLIRYSASSSLTFVLDLGLLFLLTELFHIPYLISAGCAFVTAITLNYFLSRRFVFRGSTRDMRLGYVYFLSIALVGLVIIIVGMYVMVENAQMHYLTSRIAIALVAGLWNFLMNSFVNFRDTLNS